MYHRFAIGRWIRHNSSEELAKIIGLYHQEEIAIYTVIIPIDQASLTFELGAITSDWRDSEVVSASQCKSE